MELLDRIERRAPARSLAVLRSPLEQAFWLLRAGFTVAPLLFGLDKFFNLMVDWPIYLAPTFERLLPGTAQEFMYAAGAIEIAAALIVAFRPRIGGYVVAAWLGGIVINLLVLGDFYDVALRDTGLLFGALTLARLASARSRLDAEGR